VDVHVATLCRGYHFSALFMRDSSLSASFVAVLAYDHPREVMHVMSLF